MRFKIINMILLAVFIGTGAIFFGNKWLNIQASRRLSELQVAPAKAAPTQTIVVAAVPLRFGTEMDKQHLREIAWPEGALPKGAFSKIDEVIDGKTRRIALAAIEENEPVLPAKMTGPGQRGSLAAIIEPGMKAVTVRVNDVNGVAGFVLPGERVDVLITRNVDKDAAFTDVLLQNIKVLAADQLADERADKPSLAKAVTLEATTEDAQKLTLAATVGALSLTLRAAGEGELKGPQRVALEDLVYGYDPSRGDKAEAGKHVKVSVTRALKRQEYSVPALNDIGLRPLGPNLAKQEVALPGLPRASIP